MAKILVNDGINQAGADLLKSAGHELHMEKIAQEELIARLPEFDAICIRSATTVRKDLIDVCPNLRAIARGGVGLDNVDVEYARSKGISVINTPAASSRSVAELAFAHMLSVSRSLHLSNRTMPESGRDAFGTLKKAYGGGLEITGKTLGLIGFGKIGQETASIAIGMGMKVLAVDPMISSAEVSVGNGQLGASLTVNTTSMEEVLANSDVISLHIPSLSKPVLTANEFSQMKDDVIIINCARGGTIDEDDLLEALASGKVAAVGLDVFENEPKPREELLQHERISLSPHIGAATVAAQQKIGIELAEKLNAVFE